MASTETLQAQLEALDAAIGGGYLRVSYAGRSIDYQSMDALLKARGIVAQRLAAANGTSIVRGYRFVADKAL